MPFCTFDSLLTPQVLAGLVTAPPVTSPSGGTGTQTKNHFIEKKSKFPPVVASGKIKNGSRKCFIFVSQGRSEVATHTPFQT